MLPALDIIEIFPGDPGACSLNGCTAETYIDKSLDISQLLKRNNPAVNIDLNTWGPPFFGWGIINGPVDWQGEFIQKYQHSAWEFNKKRSDSSMKHLIKRLPDFPEDTSISINMGFNPDGNPHGDMDAGKWACEIAKTNRIQTWDFSLTEGKNAITPHYRFERLFQRRRLEIESAPYSGGICFTMTPLLNQLSLYEAAQSFIRPDEDHQVVAKEFFERIFGPDGRKLTDYMPLFEVIPDWGCHTQVLLSLEEYHIRMKELVQILNDLKTSVRETNNFQPSPEMYRKELLFFAEFFKDISGPAPDYNLLKKKYWQRIYEIYDHLPEHVDPRPQNAVKKIIEYFRCWSMDKKSSDDPVAGKWV